MESLKDQQFVLITSSNFPFGGAAANYLNLFCKGLKDNGYRISVFLLKGFAFGSYSNRSSRANISDDGIPFTFLSSTRRPEKILMKLVDEIIGFFRVSSLMLSFISKRKSTTVLVYNSELQSNIPVFILASIFRIKIVTFVPEYYDKSVFKGSIFRKLKWYGFLINFNWLNKSSDKLIVFSYFLRDKYVLKGFDEKNIIVQPNLTDFNYWISKPVNVRYTIGYSGTPSVKDGLFDLFKAISILNKQKRDVSLLVIGDTVFGGSLIPGLKLECEKLKISENVIFTGLVQSSQVREYLAQCKILAITRPSNTQTKAGFPTKLGEYFATGLPVLATNFGDIERYFRNDIDFVMAESGSPESIAAKIRWMLDNREASERIASDGSKKARELLDYTSSVNRLIAFINMDQALS
jgi:glycosyltransferase involved in cell wall biosynthesis